MLHRSVPMKPGPPVRRVRVVIEDAALAESGFEARETAGMDITICSGPGSDREVCPLVVDGACPVGSCDVVVSSLEGPWAAPVAQAWRYEGVLVTRATPDASSAPAQRFDGFVGEAVRALYAAQFGAPGQDPADVPVIGVDDAADADVAIDGAVSAPWVAAAYGRRMIDGSAPRPLKG